MPDKWAQFIVNPKSNAQVNVGVTAGGAPPVGYSQGVSNPPDGGAVRSIDAPAPDKWAQYIASAALPAGATGPLSTPPKAPIPAELQGPPTLAQKLNLPALTLEAGQAGIGALKGAGSTLDNIGNVATLGLTSRPALKFYNQHLGTDFTIPAPETVFQPSNTAQSVGKGIEQAGEFLIPGLGEEDAVNAATKIPGITKPLARIGYGAITSGALNKLQGGDFGSGALMGGAGSAVSDAGRAFAPRLMEFGQGLHTPGAKTGRALLEETSGIFPGAVRQSAQDAIDTLNPEMEGVVKAAPGMVPLSPVQNVAAANVSKAFGRNEPKMYRGAQRLERIVTTDLNGNPLPQAVTPFQALEIRRGVDSALPVGSFNPKSENAFKGYRTPLRDALNEGIGNVVPEYRPLAKRISNLIPATKPAKRGFGHLWGPGAGAIFGGYYGARAGARNEGGLTGAIKGGLEGATEGAAAGTVLPALINGSARTLYSPVMRRLVVPLTVGGGLQVTR